MNVLLEVPARPLALPLIQAHARALAALAGFEAARVGRIELACEEAFTQVLERAAPNSSLPVTLVSELDARALRIAFDDREQPPVETDAQAQPVSSLEEIDVSGVARQIIRASADIAQWTPRGREGNRLMLVFNRPRDSIAVLESPDALRRFDDAVPLAPPQEYVLRVAGADGHEDDWARIARVMYRAYAFSYPIDDFYLPQRIRELNREGHVLSVVAVSEQGEVVGHYALDVQGFGQFGLKQPLTGEIGKAVVDPAHRSRGLMERMRSFIETCSRERGLVSVFSEPTMAHPFSQRTNERLGARACAMLVALVGVKMELQSIEGSSRARTSLMFYFQPFGPQPSRRVYLPPHHRDILARTYAGCGIEIEALEAPQTLAGESVLDAQYVGMADFGNIAVHQVGADIAGALRDSVRNLVRRAGARVIFLGLRLDDPGCPAACVEAERLGFFYAGLSPLFDDGHDVLRLQYIEEDIDVDALQAEGPFGREIAAWVKAERRRVEALAGR
jgi:anti-sigma regulatory factor (Ser/Thr protein kinase)